MENRIKVIKALDAVTATTTSNKFYVGGAKRIGFLFRRADDAGGASAFSIKGSMEPEDTVTPTMTALSMMIDNVTNTNGQTLTRVASKSIAASNADVMLWLSPECCISWLSVTVTETTDGTHSAYILLEY